MGRKWMVVIAGVLMAAGIGILLYPAASSYINRQNGSYVIQELQQQINGMDEGQMAQALAEAKVYNEKLSTASSEIAEDAYGRILNFGNGIMGYIHIPRIDVKLPIYHGVDTEVLEKGVGHLPSSAFPIGGSGNHAVLTGHTGLPSAKLFTDLDQLEKGDRFHVTAAGQTVTYQVDQIKVVLPNETNDLMPVSGADYCTLVTCTPYGVNSHRLLVRGVRVVETEPAVEVVTKETPVTDPSRNLVWLWLLALVPVLVFAMKRKKER